MPGGNAPRKSEQSESEGGPQVAYIGGASVRKITAAEWEGAEIMGQDTVTWSKALNKNRLPVSDLTQEALEFLLVNHDREFVLAEEGEKAPLPVNTPSPDLNTPGDGENILPAPNGR